MSFQFKQFYIDDSACAMKVGTDAIMLGSWSCAHAKSPLRVLDIGAGSGILTIMLAQKLAKNATITAIELDGAAALTAQLNIDNTPWADQISVCNMSIQDFFNARVEQPIQRQEFDLIISNPPYFPAGQTFNPARQRARHTDELDWSTLLTITANLLTLDGQFECVIPADRKEEMVELAEREGLLLTDVLYIQSTLKKPIKRILLRFVKRDMHLNLVELIHEDTLLIHQPSGEYTTEYRRLCKDYYLNF